MCFCNSFRWCPLCPFSCPTAGTPKQYKLGVEILSCVVIFAQIIRIAVIGYEMKNVSNEFARTIFSRENDILDYKSSYLSFSKSTAILFCSVSIILGITCFFLEGLLLHSVKKMHLPGIQPWFVSTVIIFLIALLSCVITFSIYVIKPIDQNHNLKYNKSQMSLDEVNTDADLEIIGIPTKMPSDDEISDLQLQISDTTNLSLRIVEVKGMVSCIRLNSSSIKVNVTVNGTVIEEREQWLLISTPGAHHGHGGKNLNKCIDSDKEMKPVYYDPHPVLSMSFLIDIIRCIPQLFLVNRFVKAEKLHIVHSMTPHPSLSALYIKHI